MKAICLASIVPLRAEPADESEIMTQLLFGDTFEILKTKNQWNYIRSTYDQYEGWIDEKVILKLDEQEFNHAQKQPVYYTAEIVNQVNLEKSGTFLLPMGSILPGYNPQEGSFFMGKEKGFFDGEVITGKHSKEKVLEYAFTYMNAPYLWGGKTHFGLDCSGLTQMTYKMCGHDLLRNAKDQATQGESISLQEAEAGDLAFFTNDKGKIIHVGFLLGDGRIFHSHGNAHIDPIDEKGIWSLKFKRYSHRLSDVRRII
jgi:hypothetical protein